MTKSASGIVYQEAGQSLLEFALTVPLLLLLVLGTFDLGFDVYADNTVALSAREGARAGIIFRGSDSATRTAICNQAVSTAQALNLSCAGNVTILPSAGITHSVSITVTVVYTYTPFTPMIGTIVGSGGHVRLSSLSSMIVE